MPIPPQAAGTLLRTYRTQRGMTLRDAARHAQTSISSLSRKERGVDTLHREFLLHVVEGYALHAWEAEALFAAARQVAPDPAPPGQGDDAPRAFARHLLAALPFPAAVLGPLDTLYAWNPPVEEVWPSLRRAGSAAQAQRHALDFLLAPETRAALGDRWQEAAERALRSFWAQTRLHAGSPAFLALIERLTAEYGEEFSAPWQRVLAAALAGGTLTGGAAAVLPGLLRLEDGTPVDCMALRATLQERSALALLLFMPCGAGSACAYAAAGSLPERAARTAEAAPAPVGEPA